MRQVNPGAVEFLNPAVARVCDKDIIPAVNRNAEGTRKLTGSTPRPAPGGQKLAPVGELHDTVVAGIGDVDVPGAVHRHAAWALQSGHHRTANAEVMEVRRGGGRRRHGPQDRQAVGPTVHEDQIRPGIAGNIRHDDRDRPVCHAHHRRYAERPVPDVGQHVQADLSHADQILPAIPVDIGHGK